MINKIEFHLVSENQDFSSSSKQRTLGFLKDINQKQNLLYWDPCSLKLQGQFLFNQTKYNVRITSSRYLPTLTYHQDDGALGRLVIIFICIALPTLFYINSNLILIILYMPYQIILNSCFLKLIHFRMCFDKLTNAPSICVMGEGEGLKNKK